MNVNFEYYRIFYYVAKYRNFTKAARVLGNSQPNITRAMNCLEQQVHATLFIRTNRGVQLTSEGEELYNYVSAAMAQSFAAEEALSENDGLLHGNIVIGTSETALNIFLVEFEPYGYLYVLVGDELNKVFGWLGMSTSMYTLSNSTITRTWSPYTLNSTTSEQEWILDEDGNKIVYDRSPFYVANAGNAKYYLLESEDCYYIPAIKTGEDFVNLISGEKFPFQSGQPETAQACECIYFIGKKYFDL